MGFCKKNKKTNKLYQSLFFLLKIKVVKLSSGELERDQRRKCQPTPVFLPGKQTEEPGDWRSSGHKESDVT